ncbi:hypothetical protein [Atopococcus tabaci]|uniref:hypothetical protein n=1 Tax=Atopococcus tabaci TaxID=269774 RepID=UPI000428B8B9|nr:hypothetical protein [Atopococcus tabaci]
MSQKFDELKQKLQNVDKDQAKDLMQQIKSARQNGEIDEKEEKNLLDTAKSKLGGGLGGLGL